MVDNTRRTCPRCAHVMGAHRAHPPRTLACTECYCVWRADWYLWWAVCLLWAADKLHERLHRD